MFRVGDMTSLTKRGEIWLLSTSLTGPLKQFEAKATPVSSFKEQLEGGSEGIVE